MLHRIYSARAYPSLASPRRFPLSFAHSLNQSASLELLLAPPSHRVRPYALLALNFVLVPSRLYIYTYMCATDGSIDRFILSQRCSTTTTTHTHATRQRGSHSVSSVRARSFYLSASVFHSFPACCCRRRVVYTAYIYIYRGRERECHSAGTLKRRDESCLKASQGSEDAPARL